MVRRLSLLVLSLAFPALPAFSASHPVITSVSPGHGPIVGGTVVRLTGDDLIAPIQCLVPCPAEVFFGGVRAELISEANVFLVVRTPAHAAGIVDVRVKRNDGQEVVARAAFRFGAEESSGARFLLPIIAADTRGSGGSSWKTDLWIRNRSAEDVRLAPAICPDGGACPAVFPLTLTVPAKESIQNPLIRRRDAATPGVVLYAVGSSGVSLEWQLRLADQSRTSTDAGTELPVLSENDFLHESRAF